jgi:hypothetical protein
MNANWCICGVVTVLALLASPATFAQNSLQTDLQPLNLKARPAQLLPRATPAPRMQRHSFVAPAPQVLERDRRLTDRRESREDVLSTLGVGLLTSPDGFDATTTTTPNAGYPQLRFKKQGAVARDIKRGYRAMGQNLAKKMFDDPRGKRIVFDIEGKPGVGMEIALH